MYIVKEEKAVSVKTNSFLDYDSLKMIVQIDLPTQISQLIIPFYIKENSQ